MQHTQGFRRPGPLPWIRWPLREVAQVGVGIFLAALPRLRYRKATLLARPCLTRRLDAVSKYFHRKRNLADRATHLASRLIDTMTNVDATVR